ncbi:MAG: S8/S53 family peptidase [Acidimicrobiia bacterium]|nr:S8/S53 family peptidase [Acidimicrobiia bacterium]
MPDRKAAVDAEVRILVRPPRPLSPATVTRIVRAELAATVWGGDHPVRSSAIDAPDTSPARNDVLVRIGMLERTADIAARRTHDLVQRLYDTKRFLRVEADLPTAVYDPAGVTTTWARPALGATAAAPDPATDPHDWPRRVMKVPAALALMSPSVRGGKGIVIGHPDSGYTDHPMLGLDHLDRQRDRDVISGDDDARDPLRSPKRRLFNLLPNPGHGTATASVLVGTGEGGGDGLFGGVAPAATVIPIRATESVVQVFDSDVAAAVRWARAQRCHVVSMSLGGTGLFGLEDAIQEAVDDGIIAMAAAGNQVGIVTAPASYPNCLGVAATTVHGTAWTGSSRGRQVDLSAPGGDVWAAQFDWKRQGRPGYTLGRSSGTSYAVAHTAGVVALWLAHHGRSKLIDTYGRAHIQALLLYLLRQPGVCRQPTGWDGRNLGAGILDAHALLQAPLPDPHVLVAPRPAAPLAADPLDRLAATLDRTPDELRPVIDGILGPGSSRDIGLLRRFEGELAYHLTDPASRELLLGGGPSLAASTAQMKLRGASPQLTARLAGAI